LVLIFWKGAKRALNGVCETEKPGDWEYSARQ